MDYRLIQAIAVLAAPVFCGVRAAIDLRAGQYLWGTVGLAIAALLLWAALTPMPTHAVKVELPVNS